MKKVVLPRRTVVLSWAAAAANVGLWIQAGMLAEGHNPIGVLSAACLGVAIAFGLMELGHRLGTMTPRNPPKRDGTQSFNRRWVIAIGVFTVVLTAEIALLSPVIVVNVTGAALVDVLPGGGLWVWAGGRVGSAALILAGLSAVGGSHGVAQRGDNNEQPPQPKTQPSSNQTQPVSPPVVQVAQPDRPKLTDDNLREYLAQPGATQAAAAVHFGVTPQAISKRVAKYNNRSV